MRNEEKSRSYAEDGKKAATNVKEMLKTGKAKFAIGALVVMVVIALLSHFFA